MISIVIASESNDEELKEFLASLKADCCLSLQAPGHLANYAKFCAESSKMISIKDPVTEKVTRKRANDPIIVQVSELSPQIFPLLSAYIELALSFLLNIQIILYDNLMLPKYWPPNWPLPLKK